MHPRITAGNVTRLQYVGRWAGHEGPIRQVAISADSRLAASASEDGTVRLWSLTDDVELAVLAPDGGPVWDVAISRDGALLASAHADGAIRLWDANIHSLLAVLRKHEGPVHTVAFAPEGPQLVSGGADGLVVVWDTRARRRLWSAAFPGGAVNSIAVSPRGDLLSAAYEQGMVRLLDTTTARVEHYIQAHREAALAVDFSPDGERLLTSGADNAIHQWRTTDAQQVGPPLRVQDLRGAAYTPDDGTGLIALSNHPDGQLTAWRAHTGEFIGMVSTQANTATLSPDARLLAVAIGDVVHLFSAEEIFRAQQGGFLAPIVEKTAWRLRELLDLQGHQGPVNAVAISPDSLTVATGGTDNTVRLWDARSGAPISVLRGHLGTVHAVAFGPHGERLASAGGNLGQQLDDSVRVWDVETHNELARFVAAPGGWVSGAVFTPNGEHLIAVGDFPMVRLWEVASGRLRQAGGFREPANDIALAANVLAVACGDDTHPENLIHLYDAVTWQLIATLTGHTAPVRRVALSPDGRMLLSSDAGGHLLIWSVEHRRAFGYHEGVTAVAFSPDGSLMALGSRTGTLRLIETRTGKDRIHLTGHADTVRRLVFCPDGRLIATASADGTARLWGVLD